MWQGESKYDVARRSAMVAEQLRGRGLRDERVLEVMEAVPRHYFVPASGQSEAYADRPVCIGLGQTISQPYIVGLMTEALGVREEDVVLEVGTGCGYQTAILAKLARKVCTIEVREALSRSARELLVDLGVRNVEYCVGDGHEGWPGGGEFERILVAAAAEVVPAGLVAQLADGGRMVIPVGVGEGQRLLRLEKTGRGVREELLCYCRFVKLIRGR